jgi:putative intracellular protease/amidase
MAKQILVVLTGADHWTLNDGGKHPTGFWAEEVVTPYRALVAAGHEVVFATPGGVVPTADAGSLTDEMRAGLAEIAGLQAPIKLADVRLDDYDAVLYPGGHGPMEDLAVSPVSGALLTAALDSGKPLGVVCHGPAALLAATREDGTSPFAGRRLTGFTNAEEIQAGLAEKAPWLLQDRLIALGADFVAGEPWAPHVVVDGNLVTGQNPASSAPLADALVEKLR